MRMSIILYLLFAINLSAQVCCSPVGNGQTGGGALMDNWGTQWPNSLIEDHRWHWLGSVHISARGPAGNIKYGPQNNLQLEVSRALGHRNIVFLTGSGRWGVIEENVSFENVKTVAYGGSIAGGIRRAVGNRGRSWVRLQLKLPSSPVYVNDRFPFNAEEAITFEVFMLHNYPMLWEELSPDFLSTISTAFMYQKNIEAGSAIYSDHLSILHLSSSIHSLYPFFIAPFLQLKLEQLLVPPSSWTTSREKRSLSTVYVGVDLAISKPYWDMVKLRVGVPIFYQASSNGFPDGTQPAAFAMAVLDYAGIVGLGK